MSAEEQHLEPGQRSFRLTKERELPRGYRIARAAIVLYFVILLAAGFVLCSCPGFFAVMTICALVAFFYGSRTQRFVSVVLLVIAVVGFFIELQHELRTTDRARRARLERQRLDAAENAGER